MSDENQSKGTPPDPIITGAKGSPGERLDQFIGNAKRLSDVAGQKAKQLADVAGPRIKQMGDVATQQVSRAFDQQRGSNTFVGKAIAFYNGGGGQRKPVIWMVFGALIVFVLLIPWLHGSKTSQAPSPAAGSVATDNPYAGMDIQSLALLINEKLIVGQGVVAESMWQTTFQDIASAGYSTAALDIRNLHLVERSHGECKKAMWELEKKLDPSKANSTTEMSCVPDLGFAIA